eukprot:scaffold2871_cov381-Prasinococcus_capsulatus_cf.AAC.10
MSRQDEQARNGSSRRDRDRTFVRGVDLRQLLMRLAPTHQGANELSSAARFVRRCSHNPHRKTE